MTSLEDQHSLGSGTVPNTEEGRVYGAKIPAVEPGWAWSSRRGRIAIALFVAGALFAGHLLLAMNRRATTLDFSHYYISALLMRKGQDPYITDIKPVASALGLTVQNITLATYPPTFLLLFEPLTLLVPVAAYWVWSAMGIGFLALTLYLLLDGLPREPSFRLFLIALVLLYPPISNNFYWGQTQIMLLCFLTLFMCWMEGGRESWAGAILGFAGLLKLFPLMLMGYLLLRRQWKAIFYAGLVMVLGGLVTVAFLGVSRTMNFTTVVSSVTSQRWLGRYTNVALVSIISHIFWFAAAVHMGPIGGIGSHLSPAMDLFRRVLVLLAQGTVLALTVYATLRSSRSPAAGDQHVIGLWVMTTVLLAPTAWIHYLVLLLIPYAVLLRLYLSGEAPQRAIRAGLASFIVGECLITIDLVLLFAREAPWFAHGYEFWTTFIGWPLSLLLGFIAFYSLARASRPVSSAVADRLAIAS